MTNLIKILNYLKGFPLSQQNKALETLEVIFEKAAHSRSITYRENLIANIAILRIHLFSLGCFYATVGMFSILAITNAFNIGLLPNGVNTWYFWTIQCLIAVGFTMFSWMLIGPLHIQFRISYWIIFPVHIAFTSIVGITFQNAIWLKISPESYQPLANTILPASALFTIAILLILNSTCQKTNFLVYLEYASKNTIEMLVPPSKRGKVLSISAQDHYVLITTINGTHLHRMTLSDAIERVPQKTGLKIHRSHWVAFDAVRKIETSGNKNIAVLLNNDRIPISPGKLEELAKHI